MAVPDTQGSITAGQELELTIEKPAAGGRMIARHDGQIVLVLGGIPGERVVARVERAERRLAFADTVRVLDPSPDRRQVAFDPRCGGCSYAHVQYARQLALKADVIADAFIRIGRMPLEALPSVAASPERGSRMRARLHVRGGRAGFYREGTHEICDAAQTGHLRDETLRAAAAVLDALTRADVPIASLEIGENVAGDECAVHVETSAGSSMSEAGMEMAAAEGVTGVTARSASGRLLVAGKPTVSDPLAVLTGGRVAAGELSRHPESFFQANRYLLPQLVGAVIDAVPPDGDVLDLYAGVGLFSVSLAASGRRRITAVEGDRASAADLQRNASPFAAHLRAIVGSVEHYLATRKRPAETIVVDPPRTGISRDAMEAIVGHGAARITYVSCDPATMARDARRLLDGGYRLESLRAFDLFPNTAHVETLGVFDRATSAAPRR